jgi:DNA-directed RNA polymerase specialized sigma24 family protein
MSDDNKSRDDFPETRWSIIVKAADLQSPARASALEALFEAYLPALRAHLTLRRRIQPEQVNDFIQEFVLKKILEQNVFAKADSGRGKFRSFMLKSLDNFVRDYFRANKMHQQLCELDNELAPGKCDDPAEPSIFETAWARQVFCSAVKRFERECVEQDNPSRWLLFRERLLSPVVSGQDAVDYEQLAVKCKFESPKHARNAMVGAKRAFDRAMRSVIKDYVLDESLIDAELQELFFILKNSDVLEDAVAEFLPQQRDLHLTEESFQSIRVTGILEMTNKDRKPKFWTDKELAGMWKEILNTSFDKLKLSDACRRLDPQRDPVKTRIKDVLFAQSPSLKMLDLLKSYAKAEYSETGGIEEFPCYFVLYMTAIAAAFYKHQQALTRLPAPQLKTNFEWILKFQWLDPQTQEYLQIAKRVM